MDIGPAELLIVLLIVVILFGGGRVAKVGGELGSAVANFRKGLQNPDGWKESDSLPPSSEATAATKQDA